MGGGPAKDLLLCIVPFPEPKPILDRLRKSHPGLDIVFHQPEDPISPDLWKSTTVLCTLFTFPPALSLVPNLSLVHLISAGSNQIAPHPIYKSSDIVITTSSGIHGPQIAEWVLMTRLVSTHKYNSLLDLQRQHQWGGSPNSSSPFRSVRDSVALRVGILGYGSIGRQVGRVAHAMGMRVFAYTASPKNSAEARKDHGFIVDGTGDPEGKYPEEWWFGLEKENLREFLRRGLDWLVVAVPLTEKTEGFLGKEEFEILKEAKGEGEGPYLTNIARGKIVKQGELIEALKEGVLGGAALDVTDPEPLPEDSELWGLENVIVTPHVAGIGSSYVERTLEVLGENLKRREKGERLLNVVRRERGY